MKIDRETANELNPLIGDMHEDTLNNISGMVGLLQEFTTFQNEMHLSIPATTGFYNACESIRRALRYESENR